MPKLQQKISFYDNAEQLSVDFKIIAACKNKETNKPECEPFHCIVIWGGYCVKLMPGAVIPSGSSAGIPQLSF